MKQETNTKITYVLIGLVIGILLFSLAQTFAITALQGGSISSAAQAAPAMVGGC